MGERGTDDPAAPETPQETSEMDERTPREQERSPRIDAGSVLIVAMGLLMALQAIWFVGV